MGSKEIIKINIQKEGYNKYLDELIRAMPYLNNTAINILERASKENPYSLGGYCNYHQKNLEEVLRSSVGFRKLRELEDIEESIPEIKQEMMSAVKIKLDYLHVLALAGEALGRHKAFENEFNPEHKLGLIRNGSYYLMLNEKGEYTKIEESYARKLLEKYRSFTPEYRFVVSHLDPIGLRKIAEACLYRHSEANNIPRGQSDVRIDLNLKINKGVNDLSIALKVMQEASRQGDIKWAEVMSGRSLEIINFWQEYHGKCKMLHKYFPRDYSVMPKLIKH